MMVDETAFEEMDYEDEENARSQLYDAMTCGAMTCEKCGFATGCLGQDICNECYKQIDEYEPL